MFIWDEYPEFFRGRLRTLLQVRSALLEAEYLRQLQRVASTGAAPLMRANSSGC